MNREHGVSRRASLKGLGAMGAAIALGGAVPAQAQAELKPARNNQDKLPASVADLAVARFGKGHS
jgi:hypothetical protein